MTEVQKGRESFHEDGGMLPGAPGVKTVNRWQVLGEMFDLDSRFNVVEFLGAGAYGVVCAAKDTTDNCVVAIKKCRKVFQSRTLAKRTLRELRFLRMLNHQNIIKLRSILRPLEESTFNEIYIVFDLMETDLAQIIRSPQILKDQHVQYFTLQLLIALKYLHSANIIHRDLKPRNLLVNGDCTLKVADFGLSRLYNAKNDSKMMAMTEYVTTRWYRAPEVLVGWPRYSVAVDMWAVGCIVAELIGRMPLFPGADSHKQLELLCRFGGKPKQSFIDNAKKTSAKHFMNELPDSLQPADLQSIFKDANPLALDLIKKLTAFDPSERISAEEALKHPYILPMVSRKAAKANVNMMISPSNLEELEREFDFEENQKMSIADLRRELLIEVDHYDSTLSPTSSISPALTTPSSVISISSGITPAGKHSTSHTAPTASAAPAATVRPFDDGKTSTETPSDPFSSSAADLRGSRSKSSTAAKRSSHTSSHTSTPRPAETAPTATASASDTATAASTHPSAARAHGDRARTAATVATVAGNKPAATTAEVAQGSVQGSAQGSAQGSVSVQPSTDKKRSCSLQHKEEHKERNLANRDGEVKSSSSSSSTNSKGTASDTGTGTVAGMGTDTGTAGAAKGWQWPKW